MYPSWGTYFLCPGFKSFILLKIAVHSMVSVQVISFFEVVDLTVVVGFAVDCTVVFSDLFCLVVTFDESAVSSFAVLSSFSFDASVSREKLLELKMRRL